MWAAIGGVIQIIFLVLKNKLERDAEIKKRKEDLDVEIKDAIKSRDVNAIDAVIRKLR